MGKKSKKGKKAVKELPVLAEAERELFNLEIHDLKQKLKRITEKCVELEKSNEDHEKTYKKLDEDRADVIAYLKRTLQEKVDEAKALQEIVDRLTLESTELQEKFTAKIAQMEHEFKIMHEQFTGDIKLLTGRLKALEHFRVHHDELMNKFKVQEQEIEEKEKEHKRMLYEVEKKFIIAKDKAMKDMEIRQLQLSSEFEATTQMCIAASTRRAIRENIAVNNELNDVLATTYRLMKQNEKMKEHGRRFKIQNELIVEEKNTVLKENFEHLKVIDHLTLEYEQAAHQMGHLLHVASRLPEIEVKVERLHTEMSASTQQIQTLKQQLHSAQHLQEELRQQVLNAEMWAATLEAVLDTAAAEIKNAIMDAEESHGTIVTAEEKDIALDERNNLLNSLMDLIRGNSIKFSKLTPKKNLKSIASSAIYIPGSLGIISRRSTVDAIGDEVVRKSESDLQHLEEPQTTYDSITTLPSERGISTEPADFPEKKEEDSATPKEQTTQVEPIDMRRSTIIMEGSIITHSTSIMKEITAMNIQTESEEFNENLTSTSEFPQMSSNKSSMSQTSSLRSGSLKKQSIISQKSAEGPVKSRVQFKDEETESQQQKSSEEEHIQSE